MSIRIAEHAGFCFGVKRATGELEREIKEFGELKSYGINAVE